MLCYSITGQYWDIRLKVKTLCTNCMIMWIGQERGVLKGDYLLAAFDRQGYFNIQFNLGAGRVNLTYYKQKLNDGQYHTLRIHR